MTTIASDLPACSARSPSTKGCTRRPSMASGCSAGSEPLRRGPMVYHPNIIIVGQGRKRAYLGDEVYTYDPSNYLVSSVPMPAECEAETRAPRSRSSSSPSTSSRRWSARCSSRWTSSSPPVGPTPRGISSTPMSEELVGAVIRLLECLKCPVDSRILGRQMVREVVYRVLRGEQGGALRALASRDDHFARIARVVRYIHAELRQAARRRGAGEAAGMSVPVFHHHFKLVTASSPLQYLKRIRLDRAKALMAHDGYNAGTAARAVGYESPRSSAGSSSGSSA